MEKEQRNRLQKATQDARKLLEEEFRSQLLQTYDIDVDRVRWAEEPGAHLQAEQRLIRDKLIAWIEHKEAQINNRKEALLLTLREMAFTALNRFVALKLMEARELVRPCVSGGLESAGFLEFTAVAQGLLADQESSYRLYLETIFEDVSRELRALFDPRDPASLLWPKRATLLELLDILNRPELAELWIEDETLGWVYQYFNGDAERKKMREESSAPRNSRELAVRNQFFTPRYVVEFLTDNTLGRIWYEMRQGNTGLKDRCRYLVRRPNEVWLQPGEEPPAEVVADEALSQEELLHQPVRIPHRPLKDPREIRMLDPACGSMHFGLYAFDLYLEIYKEAWEIAQGSDEQSKQEEAFSTFVAYAAGFADKAAFLREAPRLILQHNIHGIDIDPRATQIARLTLWLRAQRAWKEQQLQVADHSVITRSNVVCAEPMPGEMELLADFVDQQFPALERGLVQRLLAEIVAKMKFAGEAGSLLKIEDEIKDAIDGSRRDWQQLATRQQDIFNHEEMAALGEASASLSEDLHHLSKDFWKDAEKRIYAALRNYSEQAQSGIKRQLFAEDAVSGFAFIDACRKRYDVVLMNPPFGDSASGIQSYILSTYPRSFYDLLGAFTERGAGVLDNMGLLGAITSRTGFFLSRMEDWRRALVFGESRLSLFADLGQGVLDSAMVETAAYVVCRKSASNVPISFFGLVECEDKQAELVDAIERRDSAKHFVVESKQLEELPGAPLAYWTTPSLRLLYKKFPSFSLCGGEVKQGLASGDDFRFLRLFWEIGAGDCGRGKTWVPFAKGGEYQQYYYDPELVVNWSSGARKTYYLRTTQFPVLLTQNADRYCFRASLTYPQRTQKGFNVRQLPENSLFGAKGPAIYPPTDDELLYALGYFNSNIAGELLEMLTCFGSYNEGYVAKLPFPSACPSQRDSINESVKKIVRILQVRDFIDETSHLYVHPFFEIDEDGQKIQLLRQIIEKSFAIAFEIPEANDNNCADALATAFDILIPSPTGKSYVKRPTDVVSYLLGVALGRWDVHYATGQQEVPEPPDPFAPLPICPPGQLQNTQGLPARPGDVPTAYPICIPWDGILVDDPNHPLDFEHCICDVIGRIRNGKYGHLTVEAIEDEACEILGVKSIRDYFRKPAGFFADHLRRYSKSRRQAPIYWLLSAGSGSYSTWLYYHRFTQDTLYRVLRDFVEPRIQQAEREQFELESQGSLSGEDATRLQEAQTLLQDLRILKSELDLVAPVWNPNLNDGVIINHAILWRITPYTPWQKKCKECWDKLVKGDFDWAHLAFHLWPERVIPKCTTDRSLAIAHGLEERLWQETNNGSWLPRQLSDADLQALVTEHSNPAVKSALERFLAAPPPVAPTRTRASRSARATATSTPRRARGSAAVVDAEATHQVLLALTAAPSVGLAKTAIADLIGVEANALTAVIKQLKEGGQIDQLGERRGARYVLSEQGRARLEQVEES